MRDLVSGDTPFGLATNFEDFAAKPFKGAIKLHVSVNQKRIIGWMKDSGVTKNRHLISVWKLFLPKAYGERGAIPANVLGPGVVAGLGSVCTQTYVVAGPFLSEAEAVSCNAYLRTRFARFLISLRKITQDLPRATYSWLPQQKWDHKWTDADLYKKYKLTKEEVVFIEKMIRPMDTANE
jgi:site-specific DNA-methyltransferase (adenine-specific)